MATKRKEPPSQLEGPPVGVELLGQTTGHRDLPYVIETTDGLIGLRVDEPHGSPVLSPELDDEDTVRDDLVGGEPEGPDTHTAPRPEQASGGAVEVGSPTPPPETPPARVEDWPPQSPTPPSPPGSPNVQVMGGWRSALEHPLVAVVIGVMLTGLIGGGSLWAWLWRSRIDAVGTYSEIVYPADMLSHMEWLEKLREYERLRREEAEASSELWSASLQQLNSEAWQAAAEKTADAAQRYDAERQNRFGRDEKDLQKGEPPAILPEWPGGYWEISLEKRGDGTAKNVEVEVPNGSIFQVAPNKKPSWLSEEPSGVIPVGDVGPGDSIRIQVWTPSFSPHDVKEFRIKDSEREYAVSFPRTWWDWYQRVDKFYIVALVSALATLFLLWRVLYNFSRLEGRMSPRDE